MTHEVSVDFDYTLFSAVKDAETRAASVFGSSPKTLIDIFSQEDWDNWDCSDEKPNVSDCDAVSSPDYFDDSGNLAAA
jgi:hypothetical protein